MLLSAPDERPTATDALELGVFSPLPANRDEATDRRECTICGVSFWIDEGVSCRSQHGAHTHVFVSCRWPRWHVEVVSCGVYQCDDEALSSVELARVLPDAAFAAYIDKLQQAKESAVIQALEL